MKLSKRAREAANGELAGNSVHSNRDDDDDNSSADQSYSGAPPESSYSGTGSTATDLQKRDESTTQSSTLAKAETRMVNRTKALVLFVLFLAACGVGAATYWFVKRNEEKSFESKFHDFSVEIQDLVHHEANNMFRTVKSMSTTITSYAISTQAKWPFFTLPHFEIRGIESNELSKSLWIGYSPLVPELLREQWELYSTHLQDWIQEGVDYNLDLHADFLQSVDDIDPISPFIYHFLDSAKEDYPAENRSKIPDEVGPFLPVWQMAPAPHDPSIVNYNLFRNSVFERVYQGMESVNSPVLSEATDLDWLYGGSIRDDPTHPHSFLLQPIYNDFPDKKDYGKDKEVIAGDISRQDIVGIVSAVIPWDKYFENLLPPEAHGIFIVMRDTCGDAFTYQVNGADSIFVGWGDLHEREYTYLEESSMFDPLSKLNASDEHTHCEYDLYIYPSDELKADFITNNPVIYTVVVLMVFFGTSMVFVLYDFFVTLRQSKVMMAAKRSNAVVASLFPKKVRERMLQEAEEQILAGAGGKNNRKAFLFGAVAKSELKNFLDNGVANADGIAFDTKPIADLFPNTTIMFADICGFTAWSSVREPTQVFTLLETVYHAFDEIAKRRRVFKVETIGDCYVAVAGLPEPRKDHASVMARFARDCLGAMNDLTKKLEVTLGPDTGELSMRVGLHSGPVTAGVLRGDKSRFQLFGDTVNVASRMESNGIPNKIHMSMETAELLKKAGKSHWVVKRDELIHAKGKGNLESFWLDLKQQSCNSHRSGKSGSSGGSSIPVDALRNRDTPVEVPIDQTVPPKIKRLVRWNADVLVRLLKQVVARREAQEKFNDDDSISSELSSTSSLFKRPSAPGDKTVITEVCEIIPLPKFDTRAAKLQKDPKDVQLDPKVIQQLHDYITVIATMYREEVPFHNFEHASHVTMSVTKLLSRIVASDDVLMAEADGDNEDHEILKNVHDHTYGITSDPLTQFAVVLSALIHDVDHTGVPNAQLIKEGATVAAIYNNQSVAEQNSVDIAFDLLMDESFVDLRKTIYRTDDERRRFRQLIVNVVLATDIVDQQLKQLRNSRWEKAFSKKDGEKCLEALSDDDVNRKATIVLEHLIQASDVAHTMQHWHIYRKWNEAFFQENLLAYHQGRCEKNPSEYWYKGELGFFDFYIIPLAKKLKECGVFGVSCDEYLNYALSNRKEWAERGAQLTAEMVEKYNLTMAEGAKVFVPITEESEEMADATHASDRVRS